ncbi:ABC transporter permease [Conexibacter woesei]|uniref:Binding-protein-dependent transport systems inner membrane component n=1 Tax=Conexibacter woesei (strain DSM 14684 / CCUG 47730 / CIP 108061 / JCM 11494 / NBRC 100937 / ID131577) TaxID=469383 RepID=D3F5D4_CONWI|nr:ABC transporter permease [Conexibacter woesei]ADB50601.1 binding-protein-dependent transport systems inner membrane component [Conexibacter woesei DSM 14684]
MTGSAIEPGPGRHALRRLRRNRVALAFGALFLALVAVSLCAPLYASRIAQTTAERNHIADTVMVDGKRTNVVGLDGTPLGPTWSSRFMLGADRNGRDVMVRLLYGGRTSLLVAFGAALFTLVLATVVGLVAGYFGGWTDALIARCFDVMWALPVVLLGVALGVSLNLGGIALGPLRIGAGSLWIPTLVIGVSYVVYLGRPIRGRVLALREQEFVEAARAQGLGPWRIMAGELLPNLVTTLIVFFPLLVANAVLLEAGLSFLGAGVQPPNASWGRMMAEGVELLTTAPWLTIAPGLMLVLTVLSLNVFGEGVRDALDPRAKIRLEH